MSEKYESVTLSRKKIFINNLIGGLAWAIGVTLGLAILFTVLGFVAKNVDLVPIVGNFVSEVVQDVVQKNQRIGP